MTITLTKTKLAVAVLAIALLAPATALAVHVFEDVADDRFYADAVEWAADEGITTGVSPTRFAPEENVTRGQNVTFLKRYHDNLVAPADAALQADIDTNAADIATNAAAIAGATGIPGLEIVQGDPVSLDAGQFGTATATCPAGKLLTGGGHTTVDGVPNIDVFRSRPTAPDTWSASGKHVAGSNDRVFYAYAICATPAPS